MQELRIFGWCDVCNAESGARVEAAVSFVITIAAAGRPGSPPKPKRLDLCDNHGKPVTDVSEMLKVGTVYSPKAEESKPGAVPKPRPEPVSEPDVSKAEPKKLKYASQVAYESSVAICPLCGLELKRSSLAGHLIGTVHDAKPIAQPKKCPDCGERWEKATSMVIHRRRVHGWDYMAELVKRARK